VKNTIIEIVNCCQGDDEKMQIRIRQCCDAAFMLGGLLPSQCEAIHVLRAAYRIADEAEQGVREWAGRGPGPEVDDAENAALDAADAVAEAEDRFLRLCGSLIVGVPNVA
jgi:hypothetical protein